MPKAIKMAKIPGQSRQGENIRVHNKGKQLISLQVRPPGGDFFLHEQQVHLRPGKHATLPKEYVIPEQIKNLQATGHLRVD